MEKKVLLKLLYILAAVSFVPIALLIFIFRKSARQGYVLSKSTLLDCQIIADYSLLLKILESAEDHRYQLHYGIDPIAIIRAIRNFLLRKRLEGASTIEQQYIRSCTGKREITAIRKVEELAISVLLSLTNSKHSIAYSYISTAYFGQGLYGIHQTISHLWPGEYIYTDCNRLATVVAMLKRPKPITTTRDWELKLENRVNYILMRYIELLPTNIL